MLTITHEVVFISNLMVTLVFLCLLFITSMDIYHSNESIRLRRLTTKGCRTLTLEGICVCCMAYATIYINLPTSIINHVGREGLCLGDMGACQCVHTCSRLFTFDMRHKSLRAL